MSALWLCTILLAALSCSARPSVPPGSLVTAAEKFPTSRRIDLPKYLQDIQEAVAKAAKDIQEAVAKATKDASENAKQHVAEMKQKHMDMIRRLFPQALPPPIPYIKERLDVLSPPWNIRPNTSSCLNCLPIKQNTGPIYHPPSTSQTNLKPCRGNILNCLLPNGLPIYHPTNALSTVIRPCLDKTCDQTHKKPLYPKPLYSKDPVLKPTVVNNRDRFSSDKNSSNNAFELSKPSHLISSTSLPVAIESTKAPLYQITLPEKLFNMAMSSTTPNIVPSIETLEDLRKNASILENEILEIEPFDLNEKLKDTSSNLTSKGKVDEHKTAILEFTTLNNSDEQSTQQTTINPLNALKLTEKVLETDPFKVKEQSRESSSNLTSKDNVDEHKTAVPEFTTLGRSELEMTTSNTAYEKNTLQTTANPLNTLLMAEKVLEVDPFKINEQSKEGSSNLTSKGKVDEHKTAVPEFTTLGRIEVEMTTTNTAYERNTLQTTTNHLNTLPMTEKAYEEVPLKASEHEMAVLEFTTLGRGELEMTTLNTAYEINILQRTKHPLNTLPMTEKVLEVDPFKFNEQSKEGSSKGKVDEHKTAVPAFTTLGRSELEMTTTNTAFEKNTLQTTTNPNPLNNLPMTEIALEEDPFKANEHEMAVLELTTLDRSELEMTTSSTYYEKNTLQTTTNPVNTLPMTKKVIEIDPLKIGEKSEEISSHLTSKDKLPEHDTAVQEFTTLDRSELGITPSNLIDDQITSQTTWDSESIDQLKTTGNPLLVTEKAVDNGEYHEAALKFSEPTVDITSTAQAIHEQSNVDNNKTSEKTFQEQKTTDHPILDKQATTIETNGFQEGVTNEPNNKVRDNTVHTKQSETTTPDEYNRRAPITEVSVPEVPGTLSGFQTNTKSEQDTTEHEELITSERTKEYRGIELELSTKVPVLVPELDYTSGLTIYYDLEENTISNGNFEDKSNIETTVRSVELTTQAVKSFISPHYDNKTEINNGLFDITTFSTFYNNGAWDEKNSFDATTNAADFVEVSAKDPNKLFKEENQIPTQEEQVIDITVANGTTKVNSYKVNVENQRLPFEITNELYSDNKTSRSETSPDSTSEQQTTESTTDDSELITDGRSEAYSGFDDSFKITTNVENYLESSTKPFDKDLGEVDATDVVLDYTTPWVDNEEQFTALYDVRSSGLSREPTSYQEGVLKFTTELDSETDASATGDSNHDPSGHAEEHINLHHSLKDVHDSALKAVKDIGGYIHQELSAVAKKHFNTISRPLVRLMAPVLYFKDQLDTLTGVNKPTHDQDIAAWCPTCVQPDPIPENPCNDPVVPDESLYVNVDFTTHYASDLTSPAIHESVNYNEIPQNKTQSYNAVSDESDIILSNDSVYQTKLNQKPENEKDVTELSEVEGEIDIRLGNESSSTTKVVVISESENFN